MSTLFETVGGRAGIERLVRAFYDKAQHHPRLGPVFALAARDDPQAWWTQHLEKMVNFWGSVSGGEKLYRGAPGMAHQGWGLELEDFAAWMDLWREVTTAEFGPEVASAFITLAGHMRSNLERIALYSTRSAA